MSETQDPYSCQANSNQAVLRNVQDEASKETTRKYLQARKDKPICQLITLLLNPTLDPTKREKKPRKIYTVPNPPRVSRESQVIPKPSPGTYLSCSISARACAGGLASLPCAISRGRTSGRNNTGPSAPAASRCCRTGTTRWNWPWTRSSVMMRTFGAL